LSITNDTFDIKVDIVALDCIGQQTETQSICATLRDAVREFLLLIFKSLLDLLMLIFK
jgi:hypothetical protein